MFIQCCTMENILHSNENCTHIHWYEIKILLIYFSRSWLANLTASDLVWTDRGP
jgi:hypothetical protein